MDGISVLKQSRLFYGVDLETVEKCAKLITRKSYDKGQMVFRALDHPHGLFFIETGKISFVMPEVDGRDHFIDFASDGHFFGENELLGRCDYIANAVAMESSTLWYLAKADFEDIFYGVPAVSQNLAVLLTHNLRFFHQTRFDAQKRSLNYRLANLLLTLMLRFSETTPKGVKVDMHLPHEELAFMVSATRQSVTKALNLWQENGWIEYKYGKIIITDSEALQAYRDSCD